MEQIGNLDMGGLGIALLLFILSFFAGCVLAAKAVRQMEDQAKYWFVFQVVIWFPITLFFTYILFVISSHVVFGIRWLLQSM
ncbi:MAG: hypothetical protein AB8H12_21155 [Lewinella sp.]